MFVEDDDKNLFDENLLAPSEGESSSGEPSEETEEKSEGQETSEDKQEEKEEGKEEEKSEEGETKQETEYPDWFYKDKFKSVEEQAKAYKDAVKQMKVKEMEAAELRKKMDEIAAAKKSPETAPISSEELIEKIEEEYGMPFQQIKAIYDVQNLILEQKLKPIKETILSSQFENSLRKFEEEMPLAKDYRDKIIEKLKDKPIEERINVSSLKNAWKEVLAENFPEIVEKVKTEARSGGKPQTIPSVASNEKKPSVSSRKPILTKEEREYLKRIGQNPDEVEKYYAEKKYVKEDYSDILEI